MYLSYGNTLLVLCGIPVSILACAMKWLFTYYPIFQVQLTCRVMTLSLYLLFFRRPFLNVEKRQILPLVLLCLLIVQGSVLFWVGNWLSDVGSASTMNCIAPISAMMFSGIFFNAQFPLFKSFASILFCIAGMLLVTQPPFLFERSKTTWVYMIGNMSTVLSAIGFGAYISIQSHFQIDAWVLSFWNSVAQLVGFGLLTIFTQTKVAPVPAFGYGVILLCSLLLVLIKWMAAEGMANSDSVTAGLLLLTRTPFAYFMQWLFLGTTINFMTCVGAGIVLMSVAWYVVSTQTRGKEHAQGHSDEEL